MRALSILTVALALSACQGPHEARPGASGPAPAARAELRDATGRTVGNASFFEMNGAVRLTVDVTGIPPGAKGVHVHDVARCDPPSFESAAGHFNPTSREHGSANPRGPHAGDLPNIAVDAGGRGHLDVTTEQFTVGDGSRSLFDTDGSALVLHAGRDDLRSDPAGNSGARLACAVIVRR
jgi:Cu-Zn family superoxide dismutase